MSSQTAHERLVRAVSSIKDKPYVRTKLQKLKEVGQEEIDRADFVWRALVRSSATLGRAIGWDNLEPYYEFVSYENLLAVSRQERIRILDERLRAANVRMLPAKKPDWLADNLETISKKGGLLAIKDELLKQNGRDGKMRFLTSFKGVGPKYARNIMMDAYHVEFRQSIAIDQRIESVTEALGLSFNISNKRGYEECENFYLNVAQALELEGWELDRLLFNFKNNVLANLDAPAPFPLAQLITTLVSLENQRTAAWMNHNADALRALLADDYIEINYFGRFTVAEIFEKLFPDVTLQAFNTDGEQVISVDENTAILTYHCLETVAYKGTATSGEFYVSSVYVKRNETWQLLQWQITPFVGNKG